MKKKYGMLICAFILCASMFSTPALADSPLDWVLSFLSGEKQDQTTVGTAHEKTVSSLRNLGIEIPDETVQKAESILEAMATLTDPDGLPREEQPWEFCMQLLYRLGEGSYDYETGIWTPSSSDVYAFDMEIFDMEHMYTLFLQGIASIVPGFHCEDVSEVMDGWDEADVWTDGLLTGTMDQEKGPNVRFILNGHSYERQFHDYGDWFDPTAIDWINEVLATEGFNGQLYAVSDGWQGLILFYGDEAYGQQLISFFRQFI